MLLLLLRWLPFVELVHCYPHLRVLSQLLSSPSKEATASSQLVVRLHLPLVEACAERNMILKWLLLQLLLLLLLHLQLLLLLL